MKQLEAPPALAVGGLLVDVASYRATFHGRPLRLRRAQVELLAALVRNRHRVVSRDELATLLGLRRGRSVDVLLSGLRDVLGEGFVRNVRSRGWIIEPSAFEDAQEPPER